MECAILQHLIRFRTRPRKGQHAVLIYSERCGICCTYAVTGLTTFVSGDRRDKIRITRLNLVFCVAGSDEPGRLPRRTRSGSGELQPGSGRVQPRYGSEPFTQSHPNRANQPAIRQERGELIHMKSKINFQLLVVVAALLVSLVLPAHAGTQILRHNAQSLAELSDALRDLSTKISPSVVQVVGTGYGLEADEEHTGTSVLSRQRSTGSGVIVSEDGYILTNAHVIDGARSIRIKLTGQRIGPASLLDAKLIGKDSLLDLALLKIATTGLKPLSFGNSIKIKQGQLVLAFGSPLGMDNSVTMGVVSAPARQLNEDDPRIYIQTDAPINPGNSGGPLVDIEGRLVGINTFIFSRSGGSEGIGFAIPSDVVRYVYGSLKKDGRVRRGQIGIYAKTITEALAQALHLEPERGVIVEDVTPDGPAHKAGIQVGDVVLSLDGSELRNVRDLALQLYQYLIGDTVELRILRDDKQLTVHVAVTEKPDDSQRFADSVTPENNLIAKLAILGVTIDKKIREIVTLRNDQGVLVAALAGPPPYFGDSLREGDVIHAINRRPITSVEMLRNELDALKSGEPIVVQIERDGSLMFLVMETD
jgi:serine protease Do